MNTDMSKYLCMKCMRHIGEEPVCSHCGFDNRQRQDAPFLPLRTVLSQRYLVGCALSQNGDGIEYMGFDMVQNSPISIREYFPLPISVRANDFHSVLVRNGSDSIYNSCRMEFLTLWRGLARLRQLSAIMPVYDIFEENNTVYTVSEYIDSISLRDYLLNTAEGRLSWESCRKLFTPLLSTLSAIHSCGIIHGGISPTAIVVGVDGKLRFTEFSIRSVRSSSGLLTCGLPAGYAAIEQYNSGKLGPYTDIYAFAATMYRALVGNTPLEATARMTNDRLMVPAQLAENIPAYFLSALANALRIMPGDRTQTVEQFRAELSGAPSVIVGQQQMIAQSRPVERTEQRADDGEKRRDAHDESDESTDGEKAVKSHSKTSAVVASIIGVVVIVCLVLLFVFRDAIFSPGEVADPSESSTLESTSDGTGDENVLPNLIGQSYDTVTNFYSDRFTIVVDSEEYSDEYERGVIIDQDIPMGTILDPDAETVVRVVISKGEEQITLVDVEGYTADEATEILTERGFRVSVIKIYNDGSQQENIVVSVDLDMNGEYPKGTEVVLHVWDKPAGETSQAAQ